MAVYLNDAIWRRLSDYYNVTAEQAQVGDLYKRWLDEKGLNWYNAGDYFISQFPGVLNRGDAEWLFWTGGFGDDLALLLDAAQEPQTGSPQYVLNCGDMRVSDARLGSVPRQELRGVTRGLIVPGVASAGNYTRVPDEDALDITGDLDVRVRFSAESIATGTDQYLLGKYDTAGNQRSWTVSLTATGRIAVRTSGNGTLVNVVTTTPAWPYGARQNAWLRFTVQPNFGGRMVTNVYHAPDSASMPSQWTLLESFDSGVSGLFGGTAPLEFGTIGLGTTATFNGNLFYAQVRSGIDGTVVLDADFAKATPLASSFTAGTGQTVTISGASGVDSNDPTFIQHTGTNYVYLPNVAGNYMSVSDNAAFTPTSSLQIDWDITPDAPGTVAAEQNVITHFGSPGDRGWRLYLTNTPGVTLNWSVDGTDITPSQSIAQSTLNMSAGVRNRGRVILRFNNGAGNYDVRWYTVSDTGVATLVETDTGVGTTSIFNTTASVEIGSRGGGASGNIAAKIYKIAVTVDGVQQLDANTSVITNGNQTSFTASTGQTVTINRSATGKKSVAVTRPCWLFGTNSYMTVADNDLLDVTATQSFTVLAVGRKWGNGYTSTAGFYAAKQGDPTTQPGYRLGYDATTDVFAGRGGGATVATGARGTAGEFEIIAGVRNVSADTFTVFRNGVAATAVSDLTTATLANGLALNVGRIDLAASSLYADMELFAVAVVRRALNATELEAIQEWFTVVPVVPPNPWAPPPAFSPLDLSPALWLDASDTSTITASSGAVSEWRDKSGNARHVSQGTAASQPTTGSATLNSLNVLSFNTDRLQGVTASEWTWLHSGDVTLFIVVRPTVITSTRTLLGTRVEGTSDRGVFIWSASSGDGLVQSYNGSAFVIASTRFTRPAANTATLMLAKFKPTATAADRFTITNNGSDALTTANTSTGAASASAPSRPLFIGDQPSGTSYPFAGDIAEIIGYSSALGATDITQVTNYLATKWGL